MHRASCKNLASDSPAPPNSRILLLLLPLPPSLLLALIVFAAACNRTAAQNVGQPLDELLQRPASETAVTTGLLYTHSATFSTLSSIACAAERWRGGEHAVKRGLDAERASESRSR